MIFPTFLCRIRPDDILDKIDDPTPPERQPSISNTVVRPLGKYPAGFEARAKAEKSKLVAAKTEKALLGQVLSNSILPL